MYTDGFRSRGDGDGVFATEICQRVACGHNVLHRDNYCDLRPRNAVNKVLNIKRYHDRK